MSIRLEKFYNNRFQYIFIVFIFCISCGKNVNNGGVVEAQIPSEVKSFGDRLYKSMFQTKCGDSTYFYIGNAWYGGAKIIEFKEKPQVDIEGKEASEFDKKHNNKQWVGSVTFKGGGRWREFYQHDETGKVEVKDWKPSPYAFYLSGNFFQFEMRKGKVEYDEERVKRYKLLSCREARELLSNSTRSPD